MSRLRVNIVACDGVGICAHLAPDIVRVDSWGFPILTDEPLTGAERRQAQAAVRACPRRALFLVDDEPSSRRAVPLGKPLSNTNQRATL
jgi:ferredoxin